jgi:hypothetical protein
MRILIALPFKINKAFTYFYNNLNKVIAVKLKFSYVLTFLTYLLCTVIIISCSNKSNHTITTAVYFWKTTFALSKDEVNWIKETGIKKLYVRFFDVDWNPNINKALPVGDVTIETKRINEVEIIPVVFITNRTFTNIPDSAITELSNNIFKKIVYKLAFFDSIQIKEIQLDCDWTASTRDKYFSLIETLKQKVAAQNIFLSATIRLHQVKFYKKTGVPPVKRGMLMFYNMSDVSNIKTRNSIFDEDIAKKYLTNFDKYPLELDVVLPAFSWACWFNNGKLKNLINDVKAEELEKDSCFVKEDKNIFRAVKNCYVNGNYIFAGDYLRIEQTDINTTINAAELIAPHIKNKNLTVSIYQLNGEVVKNYDKDQFENIVSCFY